MAACKALQDFRRALDLCIQCGDPCADNRSRCTRCAETQNVVQKRYVAEIRARVILKYGGKCACCGEKRREFLTIDHIGNTGASHRKEFGTNRQLYRWYDLQPVDLTRFRVLCMNCNAAHGWYGYCPHELETKETNERIISK